MAINIVDNLNIFAPKSIDNRYLKNGINPYTSINDVLNTLTISVRHIGLTVLINDQEYWFKDGITNIDLVLKSSESSSITGTTLPYIELTNDALIFEPLSGTPITFTKTDYGDEIDVIDSNIAITRGNNQGIYNPLLETSWDDTNNDGTSPLNTLWNKDGWDDLTNVYGRTFYSFYDVFNGNIGNNVSFTELIMKDVVNDKYYTFIFTVWGNANQGAPLTYTRQQIDPITGSNIGNPVTFVKLGYEDPTLVNDPIDTDLTIARGNNQGIYNIALEQSWSTEGDGENSPEGTLWNSDGWGHLKNTTQRNYTTFYDSIDGDIGENILGKELIMFDTINEKYYTFKFSSWTQNNNGGGFSYTRQLINTSNVFVKPDDNTEVVDIFLEDDGNGSGIGITRGENGGIYNPFREEGWDDDVSPSGTLWNIEGWNDFSNLTSRTYQPFYAAFGYGGLGNKVPGTKCIMYIPDTEEYHAIEFISWTQGGGGGFSYYRYKIDTSKLNEGIKFSDGTILKSANGIGNVKLRAPGNRTIEEETGYIEVSLTQANIGNNTEATIYQDNNGSFDFYVIDTEELTFLSNSPNSYSKIQFSFDDGNTWKETIFGGGASGVWHQIYFPNSSEEDYVTVIQGQTVLYRIILGGDPVMWFNANKSNFRGAVIDYHAYSVYSGTIIGTIHIADDDGDDNITHTETTSGGSSINQIDLWIRNANNSNERQIWAERLDGQQDTIKIQWIAKMFYGTEYYD
jgi:hypothetical protein